MKAYVHEMTVKRPYSGQELGYRLVAAIPNTASQKFGKPSPSFIKPYHLNTSSDMLYPDKGITERFFAELKRLGFDEFEYV